MGFIVWFRGFRGCIWDFVLRLVVNLPRPGGRGRFFGVFLRVWVCLLVGGFLDGRLWWCVVMFFIHGGFLFVLWCWSRGLLGVGGNWVPCGRFLLGRDQSWRAWLSMNELQ